MDGADSTEQVPYTRVTVAEAAAALGVSVVTIRRMIKRGQLEGERVIRPQGSAYLVRLPVDGTGDATPTERPAQDMSRTQGTPPPAPAEAMVSLIQTTIGTVLGPLVGQLDVQRQTIERQAGEIAELREDRGRLTAEVEALKASQTQHDADPGPVAPEPATDAPVAVAARLRALAPWWLWATLGALSAAVVALLVLVLG